MIRRKVRRHSLPTDEDGCLVDFNIPYEALVYDRFLGRQSVKDRIDDKREDLAFAATCDSTEQVIFDDDDRRRIAARLRAGKSVV